MNRLIRSATRLLPLTAALVLLTSLPVQAGKKPATQSLTYNGVVVGTNGLAATTPQGAPIYTNVAQEITTVGGQQTQENILLITPVFDSQTGALMALKAVGYTVSHKPDGDLFILYSLDETLQLAPPCAFDGRFVIVGGTGRYAGATGSGLMAGQDSGDGSFRNEFRGTLVLRKN